jgi:hypothetical protein
MNTVIARDPPTLARELRRAGVRRSAEREDGKRAIQ